MDQCSIVLRYVINGEINEKLVAVKCCTDSTGEGMMKLLQSALFSIDINITRCIGNATDGAAIICKACIKVLRLGLTKQRPNKFMFGAIATF